MDGPGADDEPLLPGAGPVTERVRVPRRGPSFVVIAAVGLGVAAVIGLLLGAVWGLSSQQVAPPAAAPVVPAPSGSDHSSPTGPGPSQPGPSQPGPSQPGPDQPSPSEVVPGGYPAAPASSQQTSRKWHVGSWRITNTGGTIGMQATVTNSAARARSGSFTMYLYVDGQPLATLTGSAADVPAGGSVPVTFGSTDAWGPGTKTLLFVAAP